MNNQLLILSGRSGSGKSVGLHMLEDLGYYCVDGLPTPLLVQFINSLPESYQQVAVSIDARNFPTDFADFQKQLKQLQSKTQSLKIIYLDADDKTLIKRFSETKRRHPLSNALTSLREALSHEEILLHPLSKIANFKLKTTNLSVHDLRRKIKEFIDLEPLSEQLTLLFKSFGFKNGLPLESDYVFDVRCLPNPYWEASLRQYTGLDPKVIAYLRASDKTDKMKQDIIEFLKVWLPHFRAENRQYLTVAIGCTGGQHRSVYVAEQLAEAFQPIVNNVQVRHRDLP